MTNRYKTLTSIFENQAANGWSPAINIQDYIHSSIYIFTKNSANLTLKCWGSLAEKSSNVSYPDIATNPNIVDFSVAASEFNIKDTIELFRGADTTERVIGDTGLVLSGTDIAKIYNINNPEKLNFVAFEVSNYVAGNLWIYLTSQNNF